MCFIPKQACQISTPAPTEVHVFGKEDEFYDYGRDGFGYKPQEADLRGGVGRAGHLINPHPLLGKTEWQEYYVDPVILTHEDGHGTAGPDRGLGCWGTQGLTELILEFLYSKARASMR